MSALEDENSSKRAAIAPADVLAMMPPGLQYRFLDEIRKIDETHVVAQYTFRRDEFFFPGHFPEQSVTPGTILLEAMCQCGVTAHSYYLLAQEMSIEEARQYRVFFTSAEVEWFEPAGPGTTITLRSELVAWRRRRIRTHVRVFDGLKRLLAESRLSGMSVLLQPKAASAISAGTQNGQFAPAIRNLGRNET